MKPQAVLPSALILVTALFSLVSLLSGCDSDTALPADAGVDVALADTRAPDTAPPPDTGPPPDVWPHSDLGPDRGAADLPRPDVRAPDLGPPGPAIIGCSDGTREGFLDHVKFGRIAACGGAWTVKGVHNTTPACNRRAGNDGINPKGTACNVTDLCAAGWHVCYGKVDVLSRNSKGCLNIMDGVTGPAFFLARTSSTGAFNCSQDSTKFGGPGTSNDLFGCGNLGCGMVQGACATGGANCDPLKDCTGCPAGQACANASTCTPGSCFPLTMGSHDLCKGLRNDKSCGSWCSHLGKFPGAKNTWDCGSDTTQEANNVVKTDPTTQGGVLCCKD